MEFSIINQQNSGGYSEEKAAKSMNQIMNAVAFMHSKGISHRDLKVRITMSSILIYIIASKHNVWR